MSASPAAAAGPPSPPCFSGEGREAGGRFALFWWFRRVVVAVAVAVFVRSWTTSKE